MGAEYTALLYSYYCSSRRLSRGNVLSRAFELHQEIHIFLQHENSKYFAEPDFLLKLAYLCNIFDKLNTLNLSLQGVMWKHIWRQLALILDSHISP
jgi:hypothetical protein